jgi:hypothetical protein
LLKTALNENKHEIMHLLLEYLFDKLKTIDYEDKQDIINRMFEQVLLNDKVEFVEILLEVGVNLRDFLTVERLKKLYNNSHVV